MERNCLFLHMSGSSEVKTYLVLRNSKNDQKHHYSVPFHDFYMKSSSILNTIIPFFLVTNHPSKENQEVAKWKKWNSNPHLWFPDLMMWCLPYCKKATLFYLLYSLLSIVVPIIEFDLHFNSLMKAMNFLFIVEKIIELLLNDLFKVPKPGLEGEIYN